MFQSNQIRAFLAPAVAIVLLYGSACEAGLLPGPDNFHECILDRLEDVQNDMVAISETSRCRQEFPDMLPPEKLAPLFGPQTAAECLAEYADEVPQSSPYAATQIREACFQLYPENTEEDEE